MTSVLRSFGTPTVTPVKFNRIQSPCYADTSLGYTTLFPFTYSNGVLDIQYIDSFQADMVAMPNEDPLTDPDVAVQVMGGPELVRQLGANFVSYIRAWRATDAGTPVTIYSNGIVLKVQAIRSSFVGDESFEVSTAPPPSDNYTMGAAANAYRANWVFKSPLTITTIEGGVKQYITFASRFDKG